MIVLTTTAMILHDTFNKPHYQRHMTVTFDSIDEVKSIIMSMDYLIWELLVSSIRPPVLNVKYVLKWNEYSKQEGTPKKEWRVCGGEGEVKDTFTEIRAEQG